MELEEYYEHLSMIKYFWDEKGDIERYCHFEEVKPRLKENNPEIWEAWKKYKKSLKILNSVL